MFGDQYTEPTVDLESHPIPQPPATQKINTTHRISISNIDINVDDIHRSLNAVNTFSTKRTDKTQSILMYEITADGESVYKSMTLRELLFYIHDEADEIDEEYFEKESNVTTPGLHHHAASNPLPTPSRPSLPTAENLPSGSQSTLGASGGSGGKSLASKLFGDLPPTEGDELHNREEPSSSTDHVQVAEVITSARPFSNHFRETVDSTEKVVSDEQAALLDNSSSLPTEYHSDTEAVLARYRQQVESAQQRHQQSHENKIIDLSDLSVVTEDKRRSVGKAGGMKVGPARRGSVVRMSTGPPPPVNKSFYPNHPTHVNYETPHPFQSAVTSPIGEDDIFEAVNIVRLRDLRRLDAVSNPNEEKSILIRRHAVIFAMDPIRAVVMAKRIILVVPDGADSLIGILDGFMKEWVENYQRVKKLEEKEKQDLTKNPLNVLQLQRSYSSQEMLRLRKNSTANELHRIIPFELHAYEALLMTVKELETQEFTFIHDKIQTALLYFKDAALVPIKIQSQLARLKNDLSVMINHVRGSRQALLFITEDDEEMSLMNLSLLKKKPKLYRYPLVPEIVSRHDEIEELIESYLMDFASLESKIEYIKSQIQSSEELVSLRLDTSRNELLIANTALAILSVSIAFGAYITGIFGMNLDQTIYIQPVNGTFAYVSSGSFGIMFIVFGLIFGYLRMTGVLPGKPNFAQHIKRK